MTIGPRAIRALTVADIMSTGVLTARRTTTIAEAAALMVARSVGSIVVVDDPRRRPAGILTERDLVRFAACGADASTTPVADYMTPEPDTIGPDEEAIEVLRRFAARGYRHVPVVAGGELVGIVSMRDLFMKIERGPTLHLIGDTAAPPTGRDPTSATLMTLFESATATDPALEVPDGPRLTYGMLRTSAHAVADTLAALGIARGDRVAIVLPQGPVAIVAILGAALAATAAPLNPSFTEAEFRFYFEDVSARALIVPAEGAAAARAAWPAGPVIEATLEPSGELRLTSTTPRRSSRTASDPSPDDVALILHSSGTTGRPKRAPIRHRNLVASADNIVRTYGLGPADITVCVMPLFHIHGLVASVLATLAAGGKAVIPGRFNPLGFRRLVTAERATWYSAVPSIHQLVLARASDVRDVKQQTLRFIRSASAPLPQATLLLLEESLGIPMLEAYGMTEASHQVASNPLPPGMREAGSVGRGVGVRIGVMDEPGALLTIGASGEVVIQGPNVIDGYDSNPEANAAAFTNGWFRTGDLGVLDAAGYLTLVGRLKEMINRAGEKIAPFEVDDVLLLHPAVAEAVCFGAPHPMWGEEVEAVVVLKGDVTEKQLIRHCQERLAEFKIPRRVHFVDAIPRGATGKVQRNRIRALMGLA
ncbi:MAG TPA: AMP-binding protein [Chloroflexota bacterium]|nr:AMP-binding protein [Chloroflexota bacterium]